MKRYSYEDYIAEMKKITAILRTEDVSARVHEILFNHIAILKDTYPDYENKRKVEVDSAEDKYLSMF